MTETPQARSEAARALSAARKRSERQCAVCGKTIEGVATRRYCSNACRLKAYWRRHHPAPDTRNT